jgi:hypothetical protein
MSKENMLRDTEAALRAAEQTLREKETDLNAREEIVVKNEAIFNQREEYMRAREASFVDWEQKLSLERLQLEERRRELIRDLERSQQSTQSDIHMAVDGKDQSSGSVSGMENQNQSQKSAPKPYWTAPSSKPNIFSTISKATGPHPFSTNNGSSTGIQDSRLSLRGWDTTATSDQSGSRTLPRRKTGLNVGRYSHHPTGVETRVGLPKTALAHLAPPSQEIRPTTRCKARILACLRVSAEQSRLLRVNLLPFKVQSARSRDSPVDWVTWETLMQDL